MEIVTTKETDKFILKQDKSTRIRLTNEISEIRKMKSHKLLEGYPFFKKRVGNYRIIYSMKAKIITVIIVGNRGQIYKYLKRLQRR